MTKFINGCKKGLIARLDKVFSYIRKLSDLSDLADKVQNETQRYCKCMICQNASRFFLGFNPNRKFQNYIIDTHDNMYTIHFAPNLYEYSELGVAILRQEGGKTNRNFTSQSVRLRGYGRYKTLHVDLSSDLKLKGLMLTTTLSVLFETAYEWFGFKVEDFVGRQTVSVAANVYKFMRKVLYNDVYYKAFWLAVVGKGYGFRLVNEDQVAHLYETFDKHKSLDMSVNSFVGNLISTRLPYDELLMKAALDYGEKINGDISGAQYTIKGDVYSKTMYALYDGDAFSVYPLLQADLHQGELGIVALYPVEFKEPIETALDDMKEEIINVLRRELHNIELAYLLFDDNYKDDFTEGIPFICGYEDDILHFDIDDLYAVLKRYFDIYERFGADFFIEGQRIYSDKDIGIRLILEKNGMLERRQMGFCITPKGIKLIQEKNKEGISMDMSNNSGIINLVGGNMEDVQNQNNASSEGIQSDEIMRMIHTIQDTCRGSDEYEYVKNLTDLLEKELKSEQKKPNMLKTIISGLSAVSSITGIVGKLAELLKVQI